MSIEQALAECTAALAALTQQLKASAPLTGAGNVKATVTDNGASTKKEASSPSAGAAQQPAAEGAGANQGTPAAEGVTYDTVKAAIQTNVGTKGRPFVMAALTKFGVAKGPDLKPEQYADFLAELAK